MNCQIMADRGFKHVDTVLVAKKCAVARPSSVPDDEEIKSSKGAVKLYKRISSLRIRVERVIQRVREFSLLALHACVNHHLTGKLEYAVIIACGIINLQASIIKQLE